MEKHRSNQNQLTKQKRANKKQQWQNVFAHKTSKRGKIVILRFIHSKSLLKKIDCRDNLIYHTTELRSYDFSVIKLFPLIYQYSQDSMA